MYTINQNYLSNNDYEYAHQYTSIEEAQATIREYEQEDTARGEYHTYTILDNEYEDAIAKEVEQFRNLAINTMLDIGLPLDEAEQQVEDYLYN